MVDILKKLNLKSLRDKFLIEKATPQIILKLSLAELKLLGLTDANNLMKLKIRCSMHGGNSPQTKGKGIESYQEAEIATASKHFQHHLLTSKPLTMTLRAMCMYVYIYIYYIYIYIYIYR